VAEYHTTYDGLVTVGCDGEAALNKVYFRGPTVHVRPVFWFVISSLYPGEKIYDEMDYIKTRINL
jgi:hypothetical protein